ncbi:MAG TPA: MMPL family transporter [Anaeromyxobacteraceae bacterium]|nr:MMPL family transporter [Anaeromyxobacteraceae bacterium]
MTGGADPRSWGRASRAFAALAGWQARRPWWFLGAALATALAAGALALRLELRTQFDQLLPQNQPSVIELHRLAKRVAHGSIISILLEGDDTAALRRAGDAVASALRRDPPPWLVEASDGLHEARAFLQPRVGLFLDRARLERLRDELRAAKASAVMRGAGLDLGLEDEPPPALDPARVRELLGDPDTRSLAQRYPDGYFQSADGRAIVVLIQTSIGPGDLEAARPAFDHVRSVAAAALAPFPTVKVGYAGDLVTALFEYGAVRTDLTEVGALGVALVLGVILLVFMRVRVLLALGGTIALGLALTFGATWLLIGYLNIATAFLVSIVAGNGINAGIIYAARYLEARRARAGVAAALRVASAQTWLPTFGAAAAAAAAYASLGLTSFLGLKHFALVGGLGMLLCWAATFVVTPAILAVAERVRPVRRRGRARRRGLHAVRHHGLDLARPFVALVARYPAAIAILATAVTVASGALALRYVTHDQLEYDARRTQNDLGSAEELSRLSTLSKRTLGASLDGSVVVLADRVDQVVPLQRALEARRDAAPAADRPFEAVHTLFDLVPEDQAGKLPVLQEIAATLRKARARGLVADADWAQVEPVLPPQDLRPWGADDLPASVARPFTARDGIRGKVVIIEPTAGQDVDDLKYLLRFTNAFRETALPGGESIRGTGRAMLFADMLRSILHDMPWVLGASFALTMVAVVVTFRRGRLVFLVLAALLVGVAWLLALLELFHVKINFINFVALPVTFGIGVDYALNVVQRYGSGEGVREAVRRAGAAVMLCSFTTMLSYLALLGSINQGIRSMGLVAVLGEACCLVAAVLALPAALAWWERRHPRGPEELAAPAASPTGREKSTAVVHDV